MGLTRQLHVHAIESCHDGRQVQDDGEGCQCFHYTVQVIGNDRGKGIHHRRQDFGINVGHLDSLLVLRQDVLEQLLIFLVIIKQLDALDTFHHHLVGAQRLGKISKTLLVFEQLQHLTVTGGALQLVFQGLGGLVDRAQAIQVADGGFQEDIQCQAVTFTGFQSTILAVGKNLKDVAFVTTNGKYEISKNIYTERHGNKRDICISTLEIRNA